MSRVITYSRFFQQGHPRVGTPTNFIRKFLKSRFESRDLSLTQILKISQEIGLSGMTNMAGVIQFIRSDMKSKNHTIRALGKDPWKEGQMFSPRAWSKTPYHSKQLRLGPDVKILDIYDIKISLIHGEMDVKVDRPVYLTAVRENTDVFSVLAKNDGLEREDLINWFKPEVTEEEPFVGQIICWAPKLYA